ncbi:hypothetical protein [Acidithiobacillus concretivorus]|uniref:Antitoxin n=1 Tax=Acidithiobacillus concretivorus TaxID=3063952 RepID=A0ABS5ZN25_9PROT|nr:hypothetical protein [Acidithiobacillus concretivorus]MBU2738054.1 hypothetical protein [Acidithiobacillus concretivorus]
MEASFVDLRKKSAEIIKALTRKERVIVLYRVKPAAVMEPIDNRMPGKDTSASHHNAFGLWAKHSAPSTVEEQIQNLKRQKQFRP